ncbi:MAG: metallophosphoesterase, partial [Nanoarchaeota archaeon]|nr:metallophosphoesterase [Nanoarchaeota archaeon]
MNKKIIIPENIRKIGFCADIHGIYESLIKLIDLRPDIKHWFCAGDVVDMKQPIHNNQPAIRLIQRNNILSVLGNHEVYIKKHLLSNFDTENQQYILNMPFSLEIKFSELTIAVYHSSAKKVDDYLPEDESDEKFTEAFKDIDSDIVVIGHT